MVNYVRKIYSSHIMKIKRYYCSTEECNKSFRSEEQLLLHAQVHSLDEDLSEESLAFQCEICLVRFPTKRSVSAHKRVHKIKCSSSYTQKLIKLLSKRLSQTPASHFEVPTGPYSIENIKLSPIGTPTLVTLPPFSSLMQN